MFLRKKRPITPSAELLTEALDQTSYLLPINPAEYDNVESLKSLSQHMLALANNPEYSDDYRVHRFATHLLCEQEIKRRTASAAAVDRQDTVDA